jgi:DNA sulfur modification protein DndB
LKAKRAGHQASRGDDHEINRILFKDVVETLKTKFGANEKEWWMKGVPPKVRIECDKMFNKSTGEHERWQFLYLVSYVEIVAYGDNWDLFKEFYDFQGQG